MKRLFWEVAEDVEGQPLKGRVILKELRYR
jgi:hypothetical protein